MFSSLLAMLKNDDGASLVEYALIIALVAGVSSIALHTLGNNIAATANTTSVQLANSRALIQNP